jgi:hypothetical protein
MVTKEPESEEHLVRVQATRRGAPIELRVHYAVSSFNGCVTYQIISMEDSD